MAIKEYRVIKIYGDLASGNCYKIKHLCLLLDIPHQWINIDILSGETQSDAFKAKNSAAQIPLLELDDGRLLPQSNAILHLLAEGSTYLPSDPFEHAEVLQWQFFEQYSHEPYVAVARFISRYLGLPEDKLDEYKAKQEGGNSALAVMEQQLIEHDWLAAGRYTIADISLYAYTHVAAEGGFDLSQYPNIEKWIQRIESVSKHQTMQQLLATAEQ